MNKIIASVIGLLVLAGCSGYDYYKTDVRYRQKGEDCVYYFTETSVTVLSHTYWRTLSFTASPTKTSPC